MLKMNSAFHMDQVSKRAVTIALLAVLTTATVFTIDKLEEANAKPQPVIDIYWASTLPERYFQYLAATYPSTYLREYPFKWYQRLIGQFVFHKQQLGLRGIQLTEWYRSEIATLSSEQVPSVILAAAIANQGNAPTRPFNMDLLEKFQVFLGQTFDWPLAVGRDTWNNIFESPSIGITQIMPCESHGYSIAMLFEPKVSIRLMLMKLQDTSRTALRLGMNPNDWFALTLIGNNIGAAAATGYHDYLHRYTFEPGDMKRFLEAVPSSKKQLARMLAYVQYMSQYEGWTLPEGVDMNYLWSLVE